jgi:glycosyltransferase involved in cell wall biosynthesis
MNNIEVIKHESDMRKIYAVTKILLAPSLIEESYCRVIAEAMANGIPVIANRVEGIKDIWHRAAFLVDINLVDRGKADYYTNFIYHIDSYQRYIELINALGSDRKMYEEASARSLAEAEVVRKDQSDALDNFARILSGAGDVHVNV